MDWMVWIGGGIGALLVVFAFASYNRLMALDQRCITAFSDIDVQLKHRHNLIPGLVETVRGFAAHEREVLGEVTRARAGALNAAGAEMRLQAETQVGASLTALMAIVENYPEIAASSHFAGLRMELTDAENRITAARRFYNLAVDEFNATLTQFPGALVAWAIRLADRRQFDLGGADRVAMDQPVAIRF